MTDQLFNSEAFEQIKGQTALDTDWCEEAACPSSECAECQKSAWKRDDSLVFTPHGETQERSGQFIEDEMGCGVIVNGRTDGRNYLVASAAIRRETTAERRDREEHGIYVEARQWAKNYGERIVEASLADQGLGDAKSFYVHRFAPDGHEGWTGSLRPLSRALNEAQAWLDSGWTVEVIANTPAIRAKVGAWQRAARQRGTG